jgi:hypothetical protein
MNPIHDIDYHRALKQLPRAIAPTTELWPGIAERLAIVQRPPRRWRLASAASVLLAVGLLACWLALLPSPHRERAAAQTALPWTVREAELLQTDVDAALSAVNRAEVTAVRADAAPAAVQSSLRQLERAQWQLHAALQRSPGSTFLIERLRHVQRQRVRLTRQSFAAT